MAKIELFCGWTNLRAAAWMNMCWWICGGRSPPHLSNCPTHPAISQICPLCRLFTKSDPLNLFLVINLYTWCHHGTLKACCEKSTEGSSRPTQWINCDGGRRQAGESWRGRLTSPLSATKATVTPRPAFKEPKSHFSQNLEIQLFIRSSYKSSSAPHLRVHTNAVSTSYTMRGTSLSRTHHPFTQAPLARAPPAVIQHSHC